MIFENGHYAADEVYFYESYFKKSANFKVLNLKKITGTLKMYFFCWNYGPITIWHNMTWSYFFLKKSLAFLTFSFAQFGNLGRGSDKVAKYQKIQICSQANR